MLHGHIDVIFIILVAVSTATVTLIWLVWSVDVVDCALTDVVYTDGCANPHRHRKENTYHMNHVSDDSCIAAIFVRYS